MGKMVRWGERRVIKGQGRYVRESVGDKYVVVKQKE